MLKPQRTGKSWQDPPFLTPYFLPTRSGRLSTLTHVCFMAHTSSVQQRQQYAQTFFPSRTITPHFAYLCSEEPGQDGCGPERLMRQHALWPPFCMRYPVLQGPDHVPEAGVHCWAAGWSVSLDWDSSLQQHSRYSQQFSGNATAADSTSLTDHVSSDWTEYDLAFIICVSWDHWPAQYNRKRQSAISGNHSDRVNIKP